MLKKSAPAMLAAMALPFGILGGISGAQAAELKVLASGAMSHALQEISEDFAKQNGHTLAFTAMDALEKEKLVIPGTRVELARALVGIAVRDGAPVPDISTPDALKQRLISARSVAYIDPKIGGQAGATIVALLKGMGISDDVAKKSVFGNTGAEAVQKMVNGDADIAISFVSEIMPIKGAKLVGPLPAAIQNPSSYAAAVGVNSPNPAQARALLQAMNSAEGHRVMVQAGLEPIAGR